jgi:carboxylesterase
MAQRSRRRSRLQTIFLTLGLTLMCLVLVIFTPWTMPYTTSDPRPANDYAEALEQIEALRPQEPPALNPDCRLKLLTYGAATADAIALVHGYTECPHQFRALAQRFYDQGYNVLVAPLPHHGLADRLTDDQTRLRAEELAVYADRVVDAANGLGRRVTMMGLSGGGVVTAWAAQNRADLDVAILVSPGFGFRRIPTPLTAAAMNAYSFLPNSYTWWNSELQAAGSPPFQYPRYATRALVQFLRLGYTVRVQARWLPPAAKKIIVVLNANDSLVNNELTRQVVEAWQTSGANVAIEEFDANLKLPHDLVDLDSDQPVEMVHARLIELSSP